MGDLAIYDAMIVCIRVGPERREEAIVGLQGRVCAAAHRMGTTDHRCKGAGATQFSRSEPPSNSHGLQYSAPKYSYK